MVDEVAAEQRQSYRDDMTGTTCFVQLSDGSFLEGVVRDVSEGGIGVVGATTGLAPGDEVRLTLVVMGDQRVGCRCEVRHLAEHGYGLSYQSKLEHLEETRVAFCVQCKFHFSPELKFCAYCGRHLKLTLGTAPQEQVHSPSCDSSVKKNKKNKQNKKKRRRSR